MLLIQSAFRQTVHRMHISSARAGSVRVLNTSRTRDNYSTNNKKHQYSRTRLSSARDVPSFAHWTILAVLARARERARDAGDPAILERRQLPVHGVTRKRNLIKKNDEKGGQNRLIHFARALSCWPTFLFLRLIWQYTSAAEQVNQHSYH